MKPRKKVVAALSGGVDSAVSAALLRGAGHDITAVFIRVWTPPSEWGIPCPSEEDRLEAMRVAAFLDIPFETVDLSDAYKKEVVDYMVGEYKAGRTPNPDVMCNRSVKFGALWEWAKERGFDAIATGHYAQIGGSPHSHNFFGQSPPQPQKNFANAGSLELHAGADPQKDQSYFLWTLTQEDLAHIMFPVGGMQKSEVRALAEKFGLPNASRKDSQGLCFIGKVDLKEFLRHFIRTEPGDVLDEEGSVIGVHDGAALYTLGERRGYEVRARSPHETPYYIVAKDIERNTLTVSKAPRESTSAGHTAAALEAINWIGLPPFADALYGARLRYRQPLQPCRYGDAEVIFEEPQTVIPPGQSLVLYEGTRVVGGGRVASST